MVKLILFSNYLTEISLLFVIFNYYCNDEVNCSFSIIIVINDYGLYSEMGSNVEFHNNQVLQTNTIIVPPYFYAVLASLEQH